MVYLVLASASEDRRRCFERISFPVIIMPSNFNEENVPIQQPAQYVQNLAFYKAEKIRRTWINQYQPKYGDAVIIGADTMVFLNDHLVGKPADKEHAYQILKQLSGRNHQLFTGVCILSTKSVNLSQKVVFFTKSEVHMQELSSEEIKAYLNESDEYKGRAGAYSLYERASLFIDFIEGSPTNVLGLPMAKLRRELLAFGINLLTPSCYAKSPSDIFSEQSF